MNRLFYGDNLDISREHLKDESIDLIYLDPPFNSNQAYNVIFQDEHGLFPTSQIQAFDDTWHWSNESEEVMWQMSQNPYPAQLYKTLAAFKGFLGTSDLMAYLVMMAIRLYELHRVLKPTGSIYLHCDPTASHYLKIIMDQVFGSKYFRNEIIWCYRERELSKKHWNKKHDVILFYTKTDTYYFNWKEVLEPYSDYTIKRKFKYNDENGSYRLRYKNGRNDPNIEGADTYRQYIGHGVLARDWWYLPILNQASKERLGYPTQKPLPLLERIIKASSNEGDIVLDPFCGCGTTIAAAEKLNRQWIGIDITVLAINLIDKRIKDHFPEAKYIISGTPKDIDSARQLASSPKGKFLFEQWFVTALGGQPFKSSGGGDTGIDGFLYFRDLDGNPQTIILSVKGGSYTVSQIRDLKSVVDREKAAMGILLALDNPTKGMLSEAATAGYYKMERVEKVYPKVQIFTIEEFFTGKLPKTPDTSITLKKAQPQVKDGKQRKIEEDN
jgi:DNA modification methylase